MHVYIEDIGKHEGEEVVIKGWLHNRRSSGKIHFLILRDGTGFIQAVMSQAAGGTIDWKRTMELLRSRPGQYPLLLELREVPEMEHPIDEAARVFDNLEAM